MLEVETFQTKPDPTRGFGRIRGFLIKDETDVGTHYAVNPATKIFVRSNYEPNPDNIGGGDRVAFTEKHEAHPNGGEVYIAGANPVKVALTGRVVDALNDLEIIESSAEEVTAYEAEQMNRARKILESKKAAFREKFIALTGNENGLEAAWKEIESKELAALLYAKI